MGYTHNQRKRDAETAKDFGLSYEQIRFESCRDKRQMRTFSKRIRKVLDDEKTS